MKAVIQRVVNASVAVDGKTISSIGKGLLVLVGIDRYDTPADATTIIKKILTARLFDEPVTDSNGSGGKMWKSNVKDIEGAVLCVSQFTLLANFKGSKPDFHESMSTIPGKAFYTAFMDELRRSYTPDRIKDGEFGAMMQVSLTNDGPVTILLSSRDKPSKSSTPAVTASGSSTPAPKQGKKNKSSSSPAPPLTLNKVDSFDSSSLSTELSSIMTSVQPNEDGVHRSSDISQEPTVASKAGKVDQDVSSGGTRDIDHTATSEERDKVLNV